MRIEIFGAPMCSYCLSAKQYCEEKDIEYVYKDILNDDGAWDDLASRGVFRGVPQVFKDGEHVGGYSDLVNL